MNAMLELRTSSNSNKKNNTIEEELTKKSHIKSEIGNSENLEILYNDESINQMDYINYSNPKTKNIPLGRAMISNPNNNISLEIENYGEFSNITKSASISNEYDNIKQLNDDNVINNENNLFTDYEKLDDKNSHITKCENSEDQETIYFYSSKVNLETNDSGISKEENLINENSFYKIDESQNKIKSENKIDLKFENEDKHLDINEDTLLSYDEENLYKKNDDASYFNENNLTNSNYGNDEVKSSNKNCNRDESKEKTNESFINQNYDYGGSNEEFKKENATFIEEKEHETHVGNSIIDKSNNETILYDKNKISLKNTIMNALLDNNMNHDGCSDNSTNINNTINNNNIKEQDNDKKKTFFLVDNLLNLKNDERFNNQLCKYLIEEKNDLKNNKLMNESLLVSGNSDNLNCSFDNTNGKEVENNKKDNLIKLKMICLSYLRILKRLTGLWSESNKAFEYHFVNLLNTVHVNNLDNYLCCFSNIKVCFVKTIFLDSIVECIEELNIIRKHKSSDKFQSMDESSVLDKSEFHKQVLDEVGNNLTKEIIEEIFQLSLKNPYCNNTHLNNLNALDEENAVLSILGGSIKNNNTCTNNTIALFDIKKGKDYVNCNKTSCNLINNCTSNQVNHSCNSHTNCSTCSGTLSLNCANNNSINYTINNNSSSNNVEHSSTNVINNKMNSGTNINANGNNTSYNNYSIGSNADQKKCNYSDEDILNKLNVRIDYNSYNEFNNNYIQEAEKLLEKYKNLCKINLNDNENNHGSCAHSSLQNANNNNLNAYLQLRNFISEYENICKNDKIKLKDLDLNPNDINFLKYLHAHLYSSGFLEDKEANDNYNDEHESNESKKNYYDNKIKLEYLGNNDLNKIISNYKFNDDDNYEDKDNCSKYERDQTLSNRGGNNFNCLSNNFQNILKKRKVYDNYLSKYIINNNSNTCYDLNYLLHNTNVLKKLKLNLLESKKNGHNDFRKSGSNDLTGEDNSIHLNSKKSFLYKNNILNSLKNFKDIINLSQECANKKGSFKSSTDHINPSTLYDFILNNNNSNNKNSNISKIRENSLQHNATTNNIDSNNSSLYNGNKNNNNDINLNNGYNLNNSGSISKKNSYDYSGDYNSKVSGNGSDLSLNNQDKNDATLINSKLEVLNLKNKNDITNKSIPINNKNIKNGSNNLTPTNYGVGKLKYEMPVGVNPNDDKVKGVYFSKSPRGVGKWNAYFQIANNKRLFTSFSVSKYGYNEARKLSILKRTEWEKEYKHHTDLKNSDSKKGKKKSHGAVNNLLRNSVKNVSKENSNNYNSDSSISFIKDNKIKDDCLLFSNDDEGLISDKIHTGLPNDLNNQQSVNKKLNKLNVGNNGYIKVEDNLSFFIDCAKNDNESFNSVDLLRSSLTNDKTTPKKGPPNYSSNSISNNYSNSSDNKHHLNSSRILSNSLGLSNKYIRNLHFPSIDSHTVSNFLEAVADDKNISS